MIVLPIYIKKATDSTANIDATMMVVNNFFVHWLKELDIKCYPDEICILPTNNTIDIYRYSEKMLKHLPEKALDTIKETLLYSKLPVIIPGNNNRRSFNSATAAGRTDQNLSNRITSFNGLISQKLYYRIPLKCFVGLGLVNFPEKTNTKFIFMLENNMKKLFEFNAKVTTILRAPDAQILYHGTPYILYQQITLNENFQVYFNATLRFKMALRTWVQFSPYQQSFKVNVGTQTVNVNFRGANRQVA